MSSEVRPGGATTARVPRDEAAIPHALRIAFGVAFGFALAEGLGWSASFLTPVLVLQLLATQRRTLTLPAALAFVVALGMPLGLILLIGPVLLPHPDLYLGAIALATFVGFYLQAGSASLNSFVVLIAATAVPVLMVSSPVGAREFARLLFEAGIAATLIVWLAHATFPDRGWEQCSTGGELDEWPPPAVRGCTALLDLLVGLPLLALLMFHTLASATVVIVSTLAIVRQGSAAGGAKAAFGLMLGNLIGGAAALIAHGLLTTAPTFPVLVALVALAGLLFGWRIATGGAVAPLFVVAFTTFLILFGAGISPFKDAGTAFTTRVLYVMVAGAYALGMLTLVEPLRLLPLLPSSAK